MPRDQRLAVDRQLFAEAMSRRVEGHPSIALERSEITRLPDGPTVIATGPLTSPDLAGAVGALLGDDGLAFFDAIAPIVHAESLDRDVVFSAGRFGEDSDYLNCPMDREAYESFISALLDADVHSGHDWDTVPYFEGCLPVEVMATRGRDTLRFGPMKPIGLTDPRTGRWPYAVVQLRREDRAGQMWNLVGFQTRLRLGEQARVFRTIPGLEEAEFLRWGSIHRNTYLNFPGCLAPYGSPQARPDLFFAGQITGVEGYTESACSGILAAVNLDRVLQGREPSVPPATTMSGALYRYLAEAKPSTFQPMNSNWGLVDPLLDPPRKKVERRKALAERAQRDFTHWWEDSAIPSSSAAAS